MKGEIRALTGIRGIAALAVLFHHFGEKLAKMWPPLASILPVSRYGNLGVDLFFILSGLIMTYVYRQHQRGLSAQGYRDFMVKRFARIYPNHALVLLLLMGIWLAARWKGVSMSGNYDLSTWTWQMLLLGWVDMRGGWNYPNWSVAIEWLGYVAFFPLSVWVVKISWLRKRPFVSALSILGVSVLLWYLVPMPPALEKIAQIGFQFTVGSLLYLYCERAEEKGVQFLNADWVSAGMLGGAILLTNLGWERWTFVWLTWCCAPLLVSLFQSRGKISRLLATNCMVYLGRVSYALYISHALIEKVFKIIFPVEKFSAMPMGGYKACVIGLHILAPILFAMAMYHLVEEPARKWICAFWSKRSKKLA